MIEIKAGSIITVINNGKTHDTFSELFDSLVAKHKLDGLVHAYGELPNNGEQYTVLAVDKNSYRPILLVHNDNLHGYLINIDGIRVE